MGSKFSTVTSLSTSLSMPQQQQQQQQSSNDATNDVLFYSQYLSNAKRHVAATNDLRSMLTNFADGLCKDEAGWFGNDSFEMVEGLTREREMFTSNGNLVLCFWSKIIEISRRFDNATVDNTTVYCFILHFKLFSFFTTCLLHVLFVMRLLNVVE